MAMETRDKGQQTTLWIETLQASSGPGHPFYSRQNKLLDKHGFDAFV